MQYGHSDRKVPVRVFQWKQLENLYFRDKKFSIEVHDAKGRVVQTVSSQFNLYEDALKLEQGAAAAASASSTGDKASKESSPSETAAAAGAAANTSDKKDELVDAIADSTTQVCKEPILKSIKTLKRTAADHILLSRKLMPNSVRIF